MDVPLSFPPIPVTDVRDVWDWLMIGCAILSVALTLITVVLQIGAMRRNDQAIARERRDALELHVLVQLMEAFGRNPTECGQCCGHRSARSRRRHPASARTRDMGRAPSNDAVAQFMAAYLEAVNQRPGGR